VESTDRGRTWSRKKDISKATSGVPYWNCARISKTSDGRLAVVCDKIYEKDENKAESKIFIWFADSEGNEWEGPYETSIKGIVPDKLLELDTGRWIIATHTKSKTHGFLEQNLWYSDDKGEKWHGPVTVGSEEGLNLCEASILPLEEGTLVALMRENSFLGMDCYKSISKDNGLTWDGVYRVPLPGCHRPVAGYLNSGLVMITYRFFQGGKRGFGIGMQNFFAAVTDTDSVKEKQRCKQWARIMPIDYDKSSNADLGYSGWVQFDDGEIYIVNYILDDAPKAQIRGYSLKECDLY
jgi:sialidase-1